MLRQADAPTRHGQGGDALHPPTVTAPTAGESRLRQSAALVAAMALVGALAPLHPLASWAALALYVAGSLSLLAWRVFRCHEAKTLFLRGPGLMASLRWGTGTGLALLVLGVVGMPAMRAGLAHPSGEAPLQAISSLLLGQGLVLLLPLLVIAEEGLWRGLLLSALLERGIHPAWAIGLSSLGFALNHLAVAPLPLTERVLLGLMALPLGVAAAVLTVRTRCLWGGCVLHGLLIAAMLLSLQ